MHTWIVYPWITIVAGILGPTSLGSTCDPDGWECVPCDGIPSFWIACLSLTGASSSRGDRLRARLTPRGAFGPRGACGSPWGLPVGLTRASFCASPLSRMGLDQRCRTIQNCVYASWKVCHASYSSLSMMPEKWEWVYLPSMAGMFNTYGGTDAGVRGGPRAPRRWPPTHFLPVSPTVGSPGSLPFVGRPADVRSIGGIRGYVNYLRTSLGGLACPCGGRLSLHAGGRWAAGPWF